ncbi:MAG: hypothetical protein P8185_24805 [Deltaproteobacteria bacterium]|jgi:hypothetical protein
MALRGKYWAFDEGTLEVLYRNDFDKVVDQAARELEDFGFRPSVIMAIPIELREFIKNDSGRETANFKSF